jgi:hypothetical protein
MGEGQWTAPNHSLLPAPLLSPLSRVGQAKRRKLEGISGFLFLLLLILGKHFPPLDPPLAV